MRIPMLMYHSVSPELDVHRGPYYRTVTSPETFAAHMKLLSSGGFEVVTLSEAVQILDNAREVKAGVTPVVVTFDDGFEDFYTQAFPVLQRFGLKATMFLPTGCIDGRFPAGQPCLTSVQVRELARAGIEFGSHSVTHVRLVEQTPARLDQELAQSKKDIEAMVDREVTLFSFPFRFPAENKGFVQHLNERLLANGYRAGVTTVVGRARQDGNKLFLPRLPINDCDDETFFRAKLSGAYDWFGPVQLMFKQSRAAVGKARALIGGRS
jgi:peptidoglycan/xylan/chitin deacetylase (PgdA/CDA1 family)